MTLRTVLVLGADGQVGRALRDAASPNDVSIVGCSREHADITDPAQIRAAITKFGPQVVVNAAAYTNVDGAESDAATAFAVNRDGAENIARASADTGISLIHLSTDFVFDGAKTAAYAEDDSVAPLSVYGRSKAEAETAVRAAHPQSIVLRTAWVYSPWRHNFVRTMLRLGAERDEVRVVDDQRGCPTSARDIASAILSIAQAISEPATNRSGVFHFCGGGETTWYGFAREIFRAAAQCGLPTPARLEAISTTDYPTAAQRPANSVLSCGKIADLFGVSQPDWRDGVLACVKEIAGQRP